MHFMHFAYYFSSHVQPAGYHSMTKCKPTMVSPVGLWTTALDRHHGWIFLEPEKAIFGQKTKYIFLNIFESRRRRCSNRFIFPNPDSYFISTA